MYLSLFFVGYGAYCLGDDAESVILFSWGMLVVYVAGCIMPFPAWNRAYCFGSCSAVLADCGCAGVGSGRLLASFNGKMPVGFLMV